MGYLTASSVTAPWAPCKSFLCPGQVSDNPWPSSVLGSPETTTPAGCQPPSLKRKFVFEFLTLLLRRCHLPHLIESLIPFIFKSHRELTYNSEEKMLQWDRGGPVDSCPWWVNWSHKHLPALVFLVPSETLSSFPCFQLCCRLLKTVSTTSLTNESCRASTLCPLTCVNQRRMEKSPWANRASGCPRSLRFCYSNECPGNPVVPLPGYTWAGKAVKPLICFCKELCDRNFFLIMNIHSTRTL